MSVVHPHNEKLNGDGCAVLDCAAIARARLVSEPYEFLFVTGAIRGALQRALTAEAPRISASGSLPLSRLSYGPLFQALVDDLRGPQFRRIVEDKFNLPLAHFATTMSVRGYLRREADGYVHTDLADKVISVLLYLNTEWHDCGGRLRVLRTPRLEDQALEITPVFGNMLIFRRSARSWHGHLPYEGPRLSVQFNWILSPRRAEQYWRHRLNFIKGLAAAILRQGRGRP